jgi:hypothetical protein
VSRIAAALNDLGIHVESSIVGWTDELRRRREQLAGNAAKQRR